MREKGGPNMPGNKSFYDSIVLMPAKYAGVCPDCKQPIRPLDSIVYMPEFSVSLHLTCFHSGPIVYKSDPLLDGHKCKTIIDPHFSIKAQFRVILYRLLKRAGKAI